MAEVDPSALEPNQNLAHVSVNSASLLSTHTNWSETSSGICLSSVDTIPGDPASDTLARSASDFSLLTPEPSLFGSFYSGTSRTAATRVNETGDSGGQGEEEPLAEIELISLTAQKSLPRYRLRVDPCTAFLGYQNKDFAGARRATRRLKAFLPLSHHGLATIPSTESLTVEGTENLNVAADSSVPEPRDSSDDEDDELNWFTSEQIERILDYFLLCGLRVSQMTHTYEDLEAITHLLEEKQNDLELAAKIGKNLLDKNHELERRLSDAEKKLLLTEDTISQLRHDLSVRDNLLQIYSRDHQEDDGTSISSGWISPPPGAGPASDSGEGFSLASVNFSHLHQKVRELEEENYVLREERNRLTAKADDLDEHEGTLIRDCARQLTTAKRDIGTLLDALSKKSDAFMTQQSEVTRLLTRGLDLENRVKQLAAENEMLVNRLQESQCAQQRLTTELGQMRDKYDECLSLFNEARAEVRLLRKRSRRAHLRSGAGGLPLSTSFSSSPAARLGSTPAATPYHHHSQQPQGFSDDSSSSLDVATGSELVENSLASDLARTAQQDCAADNVNRLFRAMDQARQVHEQGAVTGGGTVSSTKFPEFGPEDTVSSSGFFSGSGCQSHREPSEKPSSSARSGHCTHPNLPNPCVDGTQDVCLLHEMPPDEEMLKRHSWFGSHSARDGDDGRSSGRTGGLALQNSLDDSLLSGPITSSDPNAVYSESYSKLPQRLKLIKPLDGSEVLQQWQRLATPSFTRALFEAPLPGVRGRAGVPPNADRRAMSVGAAPQPLEDLLASMRVGGLGTKGSIDSPGNSETLSQDEQNRFGGNLPSHLLSDGIRSRSLEHLQARTHRFKNSGLSVYTSSGRQGASGFDPSDRFDWLSRTTETTGLGAPFSLTSLVSALLPFSLSSANRPAYHGNDNTGAPSANTSSTTGHSETEPIRIRPRSPAGSRGLLEVNRIDSEPKSLQRAATSSTTSVSTPPSSGSLSLPGAQPPAPSISAHTFVRPAYSRTVRNTNLSEITEESGSPPKLNNDQGSNNSHVTAASSSTTNSFCTNGS